MRSLEALSRGLSKDMCVMSRAITMLISSCDAYSDLWDGHVELLNRNWPERDFKVLLVTDKPTDRTYKGVEIVAAGAGVEMPQRIAYALDRVETPYVLLTLDDYYPVNRVREEKISSLLDQMGELEIDYLRLFKRPMPKRKILGHEGLYWVELDGNYRVNLYAGIWKAEFLKATVEEELNAWQYEVSLTGKAREYGAVCAASLGGEFETLDVVRKGKILHKAARFFRKDPVYQGNRGLCPLSHEAQIAVRTCMTEHFPKGAIDAMKRVMVKFGFKFYSDYR